MKGEKKASVNNKPTVAFPVVAVEMSALSLFQHQHSPNQDGGEIQLKSIVVIWRKEMNLESSGAGNLFNQSLKSSFYQMQILL